MVKEFFDVIPNDAHEDFQQWRQDNPAGFIINCRANKNYMLHCVNCTHHLGDTDWPAGESGSLTKKLKACSDDKKELAKWAREHGIMTLETCSHCKP